MVYEVGSLRVTMMKMDMFDIFFFSLLLSHVYVWVYYVKYMPPCDTTGNKVGKVMFLIFLNALFSCVPTDSKGLSNPSEVEALREKVYASLEAYCKQKYPEQPGRYGCKLASNSKPTHMAQTCIYPPQEPRQGKYYAARSVQICNHFHQCGSSRARIHPVIRCYSLPGFSAGPQQRFINL